MIFASFIVFYLVIRIVIGKNEFYKKKGLVFFLAVFLIIIGMSFGKYGANLGMKWWIYYTIPMLINVVLPPIFLKMNFKKTILYLGLSFLSAPLIHIFFSKCLGWTEYMPFWKI
jgi:hypothetical protein